MKNRYYFIKDTIISTQWNV